jgi:hypothetical protein
VSPDIQSAPYPLRFLFASSPAITGRVFDIVYRCVATCLVKKAGFSRRTAQSGAVSLIQRFGSALNLNMHFHMLFLDQLPHFRWAAAGPQGFHAADAPARADQRKKFCFIARLVALVPKPRVDCHWSREQSLTSFRGKFECLTPSRAC